MNDALLSSKKMDYCTPQEFFDTLNAEFHFTLDAAATEKSAKCKNFYTPETDGLTAPWNIGGGQRVLQPAVWPGTGRGDALKAIRKACISAHLPFDSATPEGQRVMEALYAVWKVQKEGKKHDSI